MKRIALTFDDAPRGDGPKYTGDQRAQTLIAALASVEAGPVAFFVKTQGFDVDGGKARVRRYADAGHLIANHTNTHPWSSRTPTDEFVREIDEAERRLQDFPNRRPWFRFPYLDEGRPREKRDAIRAALTERGLANGYVTVDNYDWYIEAKWQEAVNQGRSVDMVALRDAYVTMLSDAVDFYDRIGTQALGKSPPHVLLLHENDVAAEFVDDLVRELRQKGWTLISPDEAYADEVARRVPTTLRTRQGHIAALAIERGLDPRTLTHLAIEETEIDAFLEAQKVFGRRLVDSAD